MDHVPNREYLRKSIRSGDFSLILKLKKFYLELFTKEELIKIFKNGDDYIIIHFLKNIKDLDISLDYDQRLIHLAMEHDFHKVVAFLKFNNADVESPCVKKKWTPVEYGARYYSKKSVFNLLDNKPMNCREEYKTFLKYTKISYRKGVTEDHPNKHKHKQKDDDDDKYIDDEFEMDIIYCRHQSD